MAVSRGNPYTRRFWKTGIADFSDKARKPQDKWIPASLVYIRDVIEQVGARRVGQWDGSEANARWGLQAPAKTWREVGDDVEVEECRVYSDEGEAILVSQTEAEAWWKKIEPELVNEWREEKAAANRWFEAGNILRSALADEELAAYVLTKDGHQKQIDRTDWLSEEEGWRFMFAGMGSVTQVGVIDSWTYEGVVVLEKTAVESFLGSERSEQDDAPEPPVPAEHLITDPDQFPYIAFMLKASREIAFSSDGRTVKKLIEAWLTDNWPEELGAPTPSKIRSMATFLRRPEDEKGGIMKPNSGKGSNH